jgi:hypothetical protein
MALVSPAAIVSPVGKTAVVPPNDRTKVLPPIEPPTLAKTIPAFSRPSVFRSRSVTLALGLVIAAAAISGGAIYLSRLPVTVSAIDPLEESSQPIVQARPVVEAPPVTVKSEEPPREEPPEESLKAKRIVRPRQPDEERGTARVVPAPETSVIAKMLAAAKREPDNAQKLQELGAKIRDEAQALTDPKTRTTIERCAMTSALAGDLDALAACAERLREAQRAP